MTDIQRKRIEDFRKINKGYSEIARETGLSYESVKAYCRAHNLGGIRKGVSAESQVCRNCNRPLVQTPGKRHKIFCSDACRRCWDNSHRSKQNLKAYRICVCVHCGKEFEVYSTSKRKFCSHHCYIEYRFKKAS